MGYSPWGHKESDKTYTFFFHILSSVLTLGKTGGSYTHSSVLAWEIPWTEELGELQSMGSQTLAHD